MEPFLIGVGALLALMVAFAAFMIGRGKRPDPVRVEVPIESNAAVLAQLRDFSSQLAGVKRTLTEVPRKTLKTFEGSANVAKGEIAEWAALQKLSAVYDIVVPFNAVFDFMCIRFDKEDVPGVVDFIDVKTGRATLSSDQRKLRDLIKAKKIDFKVAKVQIKV